MKKKLLGLIISAGFFTSAQALWAAPVLSSEAIPPKLKQPAQKLILSENQNFQESETVNVVVKNKKTLKLSKKIVATDGVANNYFGKSTALSADGSTLVVGAPHNDSMDWENTSDWEGTPGAIYVYKKRGNEWVEVETLDFTHPYPDPNAKFGWRVALSADGSTLAASVVYPDGYVYMFKKDADGRFQLKAKLEGAYTSSGDGFAHSLSLSADGATLAVGNLNEFVRAIRIFEKQGDTWQEQIESDYIHFRSDEGNWDVALSADGSILAASAVNDTHSGIVYLYKKDADGEFQRYAELQSKVPFSGDGFGHSLSFSADGATLAIGAPNDPQGVRIFKKQADNWQEDDVFISDLKDTKAKFGWSVALSADGSTLAASAINEDDSGSVYIYKKNAKGNFKQYSKLKSKFDAHGDQFGSSVSLSADGSILAIGEAYDDDKGINAGSVYLSVLQ